MGLVDNYDVRTSLVAWLLANATVTGTLQDVTEIRERDWQGEDFSYPNIRVTCSLTPTECNYANIDAIISYYSEQKSSKQAIQSQGIIYKQLHENSFTSEGIKFSNVRVTFLPDATQEDNGVWKADVNISAVVSEVV